MKNGSITKIVGVGIFLIFWLLVLLICASFGIIGSVNVTLGVAKADGGITLLEITEGKSFLPEWSYGGEVPEIFQQQMLDSKPRWLLTGDEAAGKRLLEMAVTDKLPTVVKPSARGTIAPKILIAHKMTFTPEPGAFTMGYKGTISLEGGVRATYFDDKVVRNLTIDIDISTSGILTRSAFNKKACEIVVPYFVELVDKMLKVEDAIEFQK